MRLNTPTRITLIRVATIPFLMWLILLAKDNAIYGLISLFVFVAGSLTDWLDGYLARKNNQITNLGKFLDQLADKAFISGTMCALESSSEFMVTGHYYHTRYCSKWYKNACSQ